MNTTIFTNLIALLDKLEHEHINYTLAHNRENALTVFVAVPGERWKIEFLSNGTVEVEKFLSTGEIHDAASLEELFARYEDPEEQSASLAEKVLPIATGKVA